MKNLFYVGLVIFALVGCNTSNDNINNTPNPKYERNISIDKQIAPEWKIAFSLQNITDNIDFDGASCGRVSTSDIANKRTLDSFGTKGLLDIVMYKDTNKSKEYSIVYKVFADDGSWGFDVISTNDTADVVIQWQFYKLIRDNQLNRLKYNEIFDSKNEALKYMKLIDMQTNEEIPAVVDGNINRYTFNMDGSTKHTFKWVYSKSIIENTKIYKVSKKIKRKKSHGFQKEFDLTQPPIVRQRYEKDNNR
jgi:hypothetical protein